MGMGKLGGKTHDICEKGGFVYDAKRDKYFARAEPVWEKEKRIEKGRKQYAVPSSTIEEFQQGEIKMVDTLLKRLREKAKAEGKEVPVNVDDDDGVEEEAPKKKRKKSEVVEEAADEAVEEEKPKKKKKKA